MKTITIIFLFLGIFSCKNDKNTDPETPVKGFTAKRNDQSWNGNMAIQKDYQNDSLAFLAIVEPGSEEILVMKIKFNGVGTYTLSGGQASYYSTVGRDVIVSRYALAPNHTGQLIITKYDDNQKQFEGTFAVTLINEYINSGKDTDTLKFENGAFVGKMTTY